MKNIFFISLFSAFACSCVRNTTEPTVIVDTNKVVMVMDTTTVIDTTHVDSAAH